MPNRIILLGAALFLMLILGFIASPRSSSPRVPSDQDWTIHIPDKVQVAEPVTEPTVELSHDQQQAALADVLAKDHVTISSKSGPSKQWFALDFLGHKVTNPSILPHPHPMKGDQFVMFGNELNNITGVFTELACAATFQNSTLKCLEPPVSLPIGQSVSEKCGTALDKLNYFVGPRELRVVYGPDRPYALWGAPSSHTCMGQWMQDLKRLYEWDYQESLKHHAPFFLPVDLQRPGPYAPIEKDWFIFWDRAGEMYIHYNTAPQRHFAKINATGGIGPDLAGAAAESDQLCISKYMPKLTHSGWEHIQQATNSLMVTLCDREDTTCFETEHNTFIMSIIHHKTAFSNDIYEPYVMLFRRTPPFELHGISKAPLWVSGREKPAGLDKTKGASVAINSIHWKPRTNNYQGYLNHELNIAFTIDESSSGAIDVLAGDFLNIADFHVCGS